MKHAAEGFEGVCSNTPKNDMQMFCAFRREDAPSRGLTAGFGMIKYLGEVRLKTSRGKQLGSGWEAIVKTKTGHRLS